MPRLYDISVSLVTENGDKLPEYGTQKFPGHNIAMASSYVPSITNISFAIKIEALVNDPNSQKYPDSKWDILSVSVYIDKNEVYNDDVRHRDAAIMLGHGRDHSSTATVDGRYAQRADGTAVVQKWIFFENGIESCFASLCNIDPKMEHKSGGAGNITVQVHQIRKIRQTPMWLPREYQDLSPADVDLDHVVGYVFNRSRSIEL
jgi:hypothetical protein